MVQYALENYRNAKKSPNVQQNSILISYQFF